MEKIIVAFTAILICGLLFYTFNRKQKNNHETGTVIILNGPSASGKSSVQKEFQKIMMPNLWIKLGIDNLFDKPMPDITLENMAFWQQENPIRWVESTKDKNDNNVITLFVGDQGKNVVYGMNSAIAAYAKNGCNMVVDYIAYDQNWLKDLQEKLHDVKTYYVALEIPLDVLEQREQARGTSPKGHARSHYDTVYGDINYDLKVNSGIHSAEHIAEQLKQLVK